MFKKIGSLALMAALAVSAMSFNAAAAISPVAETFSDYQTADAVPAGWDNVQKVINPRQEDGSFATVKPVAGAYGKEAGDVSLCIESQINSDNLTTAKDGTPYTSAFHADPYLRKTLTGDLTSGEILHVSFEFAYEGNASMDKYVYSRMIDSKGNEAHGYLLNVKNGAVSVFNRAIQGITLEPGQWYRFDYLLYPEMGIEAAVNGKKLMIPLSSGETVENGISYVKPQKANTKFDYLQDLTKLTDIRIGSRLVKTGSVYENTKTLVDNLNYAMVTADTKPGFIEGYSYDMTGLELNKAPSGVGYLNFTQQGIQDVVSYAPAAGKFGKKSTDTSLLISNNSNTMPAGAGIKNNYLTNPMLNFSAVGGLSQGDTLKVSFNIAHQQLLTRKYVCMQSDKADMEGGQVVLALQPDGSVNFFNQNVGAINVQREKWYLVEMYFQAGGTSESEKNKASLYINGKEMAKDREFSAKASGYAQFTNMSLLRIGYDFRDLPTVDSAVGENGEKLNYQPEGMYMDDIAVNVYKQGTQPQEVLLSSSDSEINDCIDTNSQLILRGKRAFTIEEFLASASAADAKAIEVVSPAGQTLTSGPLAGNLVKIRTASDDTIFYTALTENPVYETEDFSGTYYDIGSNAKSYVYEDKWTANKDKTGEALPMEALAGKEAGDKSLGLRVSDYMGAAGSNDPYLDYTMTKGLTGTYTVEASLYLEGTDMTFASLDMIFDGDTKKAVPLFRCMKNGDLSMGVSGRVGTWSEKQWYRMAATVYQENDGTYMEIYLNGENMTNKQKVGEYSYCKRFKYLGLFPNAGGPYNGAFAVDDFKIYSGVYTGETQKPQITSTSPLYTIDQEAGTLLMNQSETDNIYLLVKNKLQGSFTGYTAADCKTKIGNADKMKTGNILVAKNAAGTIFNYYKVIVLAGGNKPEIEINGKAAQALGTGKVSASAYVSLDSGETATLVLACYKNGVLAELKTADASAQGLNILTAALDQLLSDTKDVRIKAMLVDGLGSLRPLSESSELK